MYSLRTLVSVWLVFAIALAPPLVVAQPQSFYKCIDSQSQVSFQDVPCDPALREQKVTIASAPPADSSPEYATPDRRENSRQRRAKRSAPQAIDYSFECRTESGAVFYRHARCPGSIDRSGSIGGRRGVSHEKVQARRIPRHDACHDMRSVGRDGREFDDVPSTYDRNLGRDPCRRY